MKLSQYRGKDRRKIVITRLVILLIVILAILTGGWAFYQFISGKIESAALSTTKEDTAEEDGQNQDITDESQTADNVVEEETVQQEEQDLQVAEEYDMSVSSAEAIHMSDIVSYNATSSLSERGMTHSPDRLLDGDISKAWVEGVDGQGIGESVTFELEGDRTVSGITVWNGYQKSEDLYNKNSRVDEMLVTFSDGTQETVELEDVMGEQSVDFSTPKQTKSLKIEIQSVYAGYKYEDTVLSEVEFY